MIKGNRKFRRDMQSMVDIDDVDLPM